ncbi:hypothetical protein PoB_004060200 [Plakobranchus ocellatus]|uniref:Uncharacterized protein n=1 Tax=Plakobranchus ocellatus TaxID=259542 RepID=A0AAV4B4G6_9GAST|nr:hypothetical protein PoB_004060200 [Plakobranchus ocellatus]
MCNLTAAHADLPCFLPSTGQDLRDDSKTHFLIVLNYEHFLTSCQLKVTQCKSNLRHDGKAHEIFEVIADDERLGIEPKPRPEPSQRPLIAALEDELCTLSLEDREDTCSRSIHMLSFRF